MRTPRIAVPTVAALLAIFAAPAFAQGAGNAPSSDYRWAVYTGCSLVFVCILVYLFVTHRKGAALSEDLAHLERRIDSLED